MIKPFDPRYSLADMSAQVSELKGYVGVSDQSLIENETVRELQNAIERRVAYAASDLMTGMRMHDERQLYLDSYGVYNRLLGVVALDAAYRAYDETGDTGKTMRSAQQYLRTSKLEMVKEDYRTRLQKSPAERAKQWVAQNNKARLALGYSLTSGAAAGGIAAAAVLVKSSETPSFSTIESVPTLGGLIGTAAVVATMGVRPAIRGASKQVGSLLGRQINMQAMTYAVDKYDEDDNEETASDLEKLIGRYAMRDLESQLNAVTASLFTPDITNKEDIAPIIDGALDVAAARMHAHYGVDPEREWPKEWYLRWPSKVLRINIAK